MVPNTLVTVPTTRQTDTGDESTPMGIYTRANGWTIKHIAQENIIIMLGPVTMETGHMIKRTVSAMRNGKMAPNTLGRIRTVSKMDKENFTGLTVAYTKATS